MQQQNIDYSNLIQVRKNTTSNRLYKKKSELHENLIPEKSENIIKPKNNRIPKNSEILPQKQKSTQNQILPQEQNLPQEQKSPQKQKSAQEQKAVQNKLKMPKSFYYNYFKYNLSEFENYKINKNKKFNFNDKKNKYENTINLLNTEQITQNDVKNIKVISFAQVKSRLFISKLIEDTSVDYFFSENKENILNVINKIYNSKFKNKLSPIIEKSEGKKSSTNSPHNKLYGGSKLNTHGNNFLSILGLLDCKHDFAKKSSVINNYITNIGNNLITDKIKDIDEKDEISKLFLNNKSFEEDILLNCIRHISGTKLPEYFNSSEKFNNLVFIDINDTNDKLNVHEELNINKSEEIAFIISNIHAKIIDYIKRFYRFDSTQPQNYKYLFDTDVKLYQTFDILNNRHHDLYDKLGEQIYPFENAFDPHASNEIRIPDDNTMKLYNSITDEIFNYANTQDNYNNDYNFAIKKENNKYLGFTIKKDALNNNIYPCIIFKLFNQQKMLDGKYTHIQTLISRLTRTSNENKAILSNNALLRLTKDSVYFYINSKLNEPAPLHTYIEYKGSSFNSIDILEVFIEKLINILKLKEASKRKEEMEKFLNIDLDSNISIDDHRKVIIHHIIAYLYYCNDNITTYSSLDSKTFNIIINEIISILFDLKKSGDWGQVLFCSKYNDKMKTEKKECFFVTGDRLAAVRSILTNNVKTIFPIEYKILNNISTNKKHSILSLYRNKFILTFEVFMENINNTIFSSPVFKSFYNLLSGVLFMKHNFIRDNSEKEIITSTNFNMDMYKIFLKYLQLRTYVYIYLYSIIELDDKNKVNNINYDEYIKLEKEAYEFNLKYENKYENAETFTPADHEKIKTFRNWRLPNYNKFDLLYNVSSIALKNFQEFYFDNISDIGKINIAITDLKTRIYEAFDDTTTVIIPSFNKNNKDSNEFNNSEVLKTFMEDYNNINNIKNDDLTIEQCQQIIIDIAELNETYINLLCDDKFVNLGTYTIKDKPSKTPIKIVFDNNNKNIKNFFDTFTNIVTNSHINKDKIIDIFDTKLSEYTEKGLIYGDIQDKLNILKNYLDVISNDGRDVIVYLKRFYRDNDTRFKEILRKDFQTFLANSDNKRNFDTDDKRTEYYEDYVKTDLLKNELYIYYSSVILPYIFILLVSQSPGKLPTDKEKEEITAALTYLYTNRNVLEICGTVKQPFITYEQLLYNLTRKTRENINHIAEIEFNKSNHYSEANIRNKILFDALPDKQKIKTRERKRVNSPLNSTNSSLSPPAKKYKAGSRTPPRISSREKEKIRNDRENIIKLYNKLKGTSPNDFTFNKTLFTSEIVNFDKAKFLTDFPVQEPHNIHPSEEEKLKNIGVLIYILSYFEKTINDRTFNMFKTMNKIFNINKSLLVKKIIEMRLKYYFKVDYVIIPIIYKYLKFFISFKEKILFNKKTTHDFDTIYKEQHKDKIDKLLYNMDILFKISKDINIADYTTDEKKHIDDADYVDDIDDSESESESDDME